MRLLVYSLDNLLRKIEGVFTFQDDPRCLFRLQVSKAPHPMRFPSLEVAAGETVLVLHLWNEHVPAMPVAGPDLAWAARVWRLLVGSLEDLAYHIQGDTRLRQIPVLYGVTILPSPGEDSAGARLLRQLGFVVCPHCHPWGRFGVFWENLYTWGLMWTFNPASLHSRRFNSLRRYEIWMPTRDFIARYTLKQAEQHSNVGDRMKA